MTGLRRETVGAYVTLTGPDGVGKSTLADGIARCSPFQPCVRGHWRPEVLPPLARIRGGQSTGEVLPHARPPYGRAGSTLRLVYYWADFVIGYWIRVRPVVRRGGLFLLERGWSDMLTDRRRYLTRPLPRLERVLDRLVPKPDITLVLDAPPSVVFARKNELSPDEIASQRSVWQQRARTCTNVEIIDATQAPDKVLEDALSAVRAASRSGVVV